MCWTSLNLDIVIVSQDGFITAINNGETKIIITINNNIMETINVSVIIPINKITMNIESLVLNFQESYELKPNIFPENATNKNVFWFSSNPMIANVTPTGIVTGLSGGNANIILSSVDNNTIININVNVIVPITKINVKINNITLNLFQDVKIIATTEPPNQTIIWSSDNNIVTVTELGVVTGQKYGNTIITLRSIDGNIKTYVNVKVIKPIENLSSSKSILKYINHKNL